MSNESTNLNENNQQHRGAPFSVAPKFLRGLWVTPFAFMFFYIAAHATGLGFTIDALYAAPGPAWIALGLAAVALGLMVYRVGFATSPDVGELVRWQGLIVPLHKKRIPLPPSPTVGLSMKRSVNRNSSSDAGGRTTIITYPVSITSSQGEVEVCTLTTYLKARKTAERLAKMLNAGMLDVARGGESYRDVDGLDEPVGQRYRRMGLASFPPPAAPPEGRLSLTLCDDTTTQISIAPKRITFSALFIPLVTCTIAAMGLTQQGDALAANVGFLTPALVALLANLFKLAIVVQVLLLLFGKLRPANKVTITNDRVSLTIASLWKRSMKADDIEDVFGPPDRASGADIFPFEKHSGNDQPAASGLAGTMLKKMISFIEMSVIVQGDRRSLRLDSSLSIEEAKWLKNAVLHRLVNGETA